MAGPNRTEARAIELSCSLEQAPYSFDFFQAVRHIDCIYRDKPRTGRSLRLADDPVRLGQDVSLAFAPSTLSSFHPRKNGRPSRLAGYFFGLLGPNGPMPIHLTEYIYDRLYNSKDPTFARFLDVFHHRMLSLFYRAWANARPTVSFDRPEEDTFGIQLGGLAGIGMASLRNRDALPDVTKLHYAGLLACQTHHAGGLRSMIANFFKQRVVILEFIGAWMDLPSSARCRLGGDAANATLGKTAIAGASVWGRQQKFRIVIGPMDFESYQRLLPGSDNLQRLIAMVRNYVGDELAWDVNMLLRRDEVPNVRLGENGKLGWTSWLGTRQTATDADDLLLEPLAHAN